MSLIEYTLEGKIDKVQKAIDLIREFEPLKNGLYDTPYYVAYSGGKDSDAIRILFELAGVKYDLVHNHTTVDAPETVRYIRSIPNVQIIYPKLSMWQLIEKKGMPPTRLVRYCCSELKEKGGDGRFVATGVRKSESVKRKNLTEAEIIINNKNQKDKIREEIILANDNSEKRRIIENCQLKGKRVLNPIIDWEESDVWEFLEYYNCKSNPLYQCGYKRVGCVGCPMSTHQKQELEKYSKYKLNYIKAFDRMLKRFGKDVGWQNGKDVYDWWVGNEKKKDKQISGQMSLFANEMED